MSGDSSGAAIRWLTLFLPARRSARWLGAVAMLVGLAAHASLAPPSITADTYEVQPGDSASAIAERLGVPTHLLLALNPQIESPNLLFAGQILTVPDGYGLPEGSTLPAAAQLVHTVQEGDTLSLIADRYGVSTIDLLLLNPGLDPDLIAIGAQIVVLSEGGVPVVSGPAPPLAVDSDPAVVSYRVQPGDTYSAIAARFGLSQAELFALNPTMPPTDVLFVGDSLLVPAAAAPEPPAGDPLQAPRTVHVVQPGDTALALAELYGVTLAELRILNPGLNPRSTQYRPDPRRSQYRAACRRAGASCRRPAAGAAHHLRRTARRHGARAGGAVRHDLGGAAHSQSGPQPRSTQYRPSPRPSGHRTTRCCCRSGHGNAHDLHNPGGRHAE